MASIKMERKENMNMSSFAVENGPRVFVGGLDLATKDAALETYFTQFGTLTEARVTLNDFDKSSKGFGFVTFSDDAELDACQRGRPHFIDGCNVSTFRYVPKELDRKNMSFMDAPRGHCKKLYVSDLAQSVTEDDLNCYFGQYGSIIGIELKVGNTQETGKWKGNFAFIEFDDYDPVDKCIIEGEHKLEGKRIVVRRALSKHGKDHERKVFVGPLTDQITDEMLFKYYSSFGKLTRIERPLDKKTKMRRDFAFMEFETMDPVEKIVETEKHVIEGHELRVKKVGAKDWGQRDDKNMNMAKMLTNQSAMWNPMAPINLTPIGMPIGMFGQRPFSIAGINQGYGAMPQGFAVPDPRFYGLPGTRSLPSSPGRVKSNRAMQRFNPYDTMREAEIPEPLLMKYFSNFGNVIKVERPFDSKNMRFRDYAFVEFEDPNSVRMCMLIPGHQIMGQKLVVRKGSSKGEPNMERKLFVDLKGKSKNT